MALQIKTTRRPYKRLQRVVDTVTAEVLCDNFHQY